MRRRAFLLSGLLAACAPTVQQVGTPRPDFAGPRFTSDRFVTFDGTRLASRRGPWKPSGGWPAC